MSTLKRQRDAYEDVRSCEGRLEDKVWYHGQLSRDEAQAKLIRPGTLREGFFLVRKGSAGLVLSVQESGQMRNYRISEQTRNGYTCFSIDDGPRFPNVPTLIEFYRTAKPGDLPIKLRTHCPNKDLSSPHFEFGRYGVAWLSSSGQPEEEVAAEAAVAYETYRKEVAVLYAERPRLLSKFTAAARAVVAAKRMNWQARSKKIIDEVDYEDVAPDMPENPKTKRFNQLHATFRKSAAVESKMHLIWLNEKMKAAGLAEVENLRESLLSGVVIIKLLHLLTGKAKPMHTERPVSDIQMKDNWHAAIYYMKKTDIPTYDLKSDDLANADQRSMLKLFNILMKWDADQNAAADAELSTQG